MVSGRTISLNLSDWPLSVWLSLEIIASSVKAFLMSIKMIASLWVLPRFSMVAERVISGFRAKPGM